MNWERWKRAEAVREESRWSTHSAPSCLGSRSVLKPGGANALVYLTDSTAMGNLHIL